MDNFLFSTHAAKPQFYGDRIVDRHRVDVRLCDISDISDGGDADSIYVRHDIKHSHDPFSIRVCVDVDVCHDDS